MISTRPSAKHEPGAQGRCTPSAASAPRILVVEDDADVAPLLTYNLEAEGYVVESVDRGDEAELRLTKSVPDLVILDWMLPGVSGLEICRRLRARESTRTLPVIIVTARGEEGERVRGLSVGADDYVVKPFSVPELMARVRALLRRSHPERIVERLSVGDLDLDRQTRRVRRGSRDIHLAPIEFRLLERPLEKPGRVFSRANCSTERGARPQRSTSEPSTCMSVACAGRCRRRVNAIQSAPFAAPATLSTRPSANHNAHTGRAFGSPGVPPPRETMAALDGAVQGSLAAFTAALGPQASEGTGAGVSDCVLRQYG
jgi:two-component system phosphate regulon response regulator PhoB